MNPFGPPTKKWRACKNFAKLNGNHLLMANLFKLHKYQTIGLLKCIIWAKSNLAILNPVCKKFVLRLTGCRNCYFLIFAFFYFSIFKMTIVKNNMGKPSFFIMNFVGSYEVLLRQKYFWYTYFWPWNNGPLKKFWKFHGNAFRFFIFTKWKKYYNLTFDETFIMYCCALS